MSTRFDVNNRELNKRRFNDQYAHIVQASKGRPNQKTKFKLKEVQLSLTPDNDLSAEVAATSKDGDKLNTDGLKKLLDFGEEVQSKNADLLQLAESSSEVASKISADDDLVELMAMKNSTPAKSDKQMVQPS